MPTTILCLLLLAGCTTRPNAAVCCETKTECAAIQVTDVRPCSTGVCVANQCESTGCDGNEDCGGATTFCIDNTCVGCDSDDACEASAPICDPTAHECRKCGNDPECASGVCDLGTGTCVDETAILFASPGGTTIDACTREMPCSLAHAISRVDATRPYIEMTPGVYTTGGTLSAKAATIVADDATLRVVDVDDELKVRDGASVTIRHLKLRTSAGNYLTPINCLQSSVDAFNLDAIGAGIQADDCASVKVSSSRFVESGIAFSAGLVQDATLTVDRSQFFGKGIYLTGGPFVTDITNSLIVAAAGEIAIWTRRLFNGRPNVKSRIAFNTVIGGRVLCDDPEDGWGRYFEANIFMNQEMPLQTSSYCNYNYNLVVPDQGALGGAGNISGDPRFVDPANDNYRLQLGSPAIDAADPTAVDDHDLDNAPRPQGGRADIGAYEFKP